MSARLGIYFGLEEQLYRDDPALGSSDIRKLRRNPTSFWWESAMNPHRPKDKNTPARIRGSAMHKLVLEGEAAFDAIYARGPEHDEDMTPAEKSALTKEFKKKIASTGKVMLPADDYDRVVISKSMIVLNPSLKTAFQGGIPEVSLFWERDGVRRKARIDYLKPLGLGDLKGCANTKDIAFDAACRNDIANYDYHIQPAHYLEGSALIPQFVADGCVYGDHDAALFKSIVKGKKVGWQWVFFQMEKAPITWSYKISLENLPVLDTARRDIEIAVSRYVANMDKFGDSPWISVEKTQELFIESMPPWFARTTAEEMTELDYWMQSKQSDRR